MFFWCLSLVHKGRKSGAVVRALASYQCGPGLNPGVDAICGLSLLLILSFAPRGFSPGTPVFPSPQKPTLPNSNSIWNARTRLNKFLRTPKCFLGKKKTIYNIFLYIILHLSHEKIVLFGSTFLMLYFSWSIGANFLVYILWWSRILMNKNIAALLKLMSHIVSCQCECLKIANTQIAPEDHSLPHHYDI